LNWRAGENLWRARGGFEIMWMCECLENDMREEREGYCPRCDTSKPERGAIAQPQCPIDPVVRAKEIEDRFRFIREQGE
jgi:hypothetical protein